MITLVEQERMARPDGFYELYERSRSLVVQVQAGVGDPLDERQDALSLLECWVATFGPGFARRKADEERQQP